MQPRRFAGEYLHLLPPLVPWKASSSLLLLDDPACFSQWGLLTPDQFTREAKRQGPAPPPGGLEELHRRRLLVPLFRVDLQALSGLKCEQIRYLPAQVLPELSNDGLVIDCAREPFVPWYSASGEARSAHFYAPWQLLGIEHLADAFRSSTARRTRTGIRQTLPAATPLERHQARRLRNLVMVLTRLDHRYRPSITGRLRGDVEEWSQGAKLLATEVLHQCCCSPADLVQQAESLLNGARTGDPLGKWFRIVRHANFNGLEALNGPARAALLRRIAAELLLDLHEDLVDEGEVADLPAVSDRFWEPRHERLRSDRSELDRALLDLGVSPHPRLIVAVEGETEELIMPRVLEQIGIPLGDGRVELVNLRGIDHDLEVLARYAGAPRLGAAFPDGVMLRRPLAHIAIAVDREKRYRTATDRADIKRKLVRNLEHGVPAHYRTRRFRADLNHLVSIQTWGPKPFEFAHFSDRELAEAVIEITHTSRPPVTVRKALANARRDSNPDVTRALKRLVPRISKPALAEALWPSLKARIEASLEGSAKAPPILKAALKIQHHLEDVAPVRAIRL
jgi:hypothetical protein